MINVKLLLINVVSCGGFVVMKFWIVNITNTISQKPTAKPMTNINK